MSPRMILEPYQFVRFAECWSNASAPWRRASSSHSWLRIDWRSMPCEISSARGETVENDDFWPMRAQPLPRQCGLRSAASGESKVVEKRLDPFSWEHWDHSRPFQVFRRRKRERERASKLVLYPPFVGVWRGLLRTPEAAKFSIDYVLPTGVQRPLVKRRFAPMGTESDLATGSRIANSTEVESQGRLFFKRG